MLHPAPPRETVLLPLSSRRESVPAANARPACHSSLQPLPMWPTQPDTSLQPSEQIETPLPLLRATRSRDQSFADISPDPPSDQIATDSQISMPLPHRMNLQPLAPATYAPHAARPWSAQIQFVFALVAKRGTPRASLRWNCRFSFESGSGFQSVRSVQIRGKSAS